MPNTVSKALVIPNTGDFPGLWGSTALNPDFIAIDGMFGGFVSIGLGAANATLTQPTGGITPGAGPTQSQNALIRFSGALAANCVVTFPLPGYYIVENLCTNIASYYVQITNGGGGEVIGAPPGQQMHVFSDGTNVRFINMPPVGSLLDLCVATTPPWIAACTVKPWLLGDGTVYTSSLFPTLSVQLGSTFGGNGINTFGVPNLTNRSRVPIAATSTAALLTSAVSGIDGTAWGASGGDQRAQQHTHAAAVTDPGHAHPSPSATGGGGGGNNLTGGTVVGSTINGSAVTGITVANATSGAGSSQNVPPTLIHGITLIKT
jgi:microcystin-dependent protein